MSAFGDSMGGAVHHDDVSKIISRFGLHGICSPPKPGLITSGTQLMLFTADALIRNRIGQNTRAGALQEIRHAYLRWLKTQKVVGSNESDQTQIRGDGTQGWLAEMMQMHQVRISDPCVSSSLKSGANGTIESPINTNANGVALTRVVPIGLAFGPSEGFWLAARAAAFTNGHPIACYASAALAHLLADLVAGNQMAFAIESLTNAFKGRPEAYSVLSEIREAARKATKQPRSLDVLEGFFAKESADHVLAAAVYCFLSESEPSRATWSLALAANNSGPSALTASVTGALLGAWHGSQMINRRWLARMELIRPIVQIADDLCDSFDGVFNEVDEAAYPAIQTG